jgi:hypothetical protein
MNNYFFKPSKLLQSTLTLLILLGSDDYILDSGGPLFVQADQPVHCLRGQVYGVWNFHVNQAVENVDLFSVKEVCTHQLPNKLQVIGSNHVWKF